MFNLLVRCGALYVSILAKLCMHTYTRYIATCARVFWPHDKFQDDAIGSILM